MLADEMAHPGVLSSDNLSDIYALVAQLARDGAMTDLGIWFSKQDPAFDLWRQDKPTSWWQLATILNPTTDRSSAPLALAVALFPSGMSLKDLPAKTPLAWTRGLEPAGTWRDDSPYGDWGGFIVYADGSLVQISRAIHGKLVKFDTTEPTSNIAQALPPGTRVSEYKPPPDMAAKGRASRRAVWVADAVPVGGAILLPIFILTGIVLHRRGGNPAIVTCITAACICLAVLLFGMLV